MKEFLKNTLYASIGAAFLTKDKIDGLVGDLVEKGKLSQEEGKQFVDDLLKKSNEARDQLDLKINQIVEEQIKKLNIATSDEVSELRRQVNELQVALNKTTEQ